MTHSWRLDSAEERAKEAKYTFYKPSDKVLNQLKEGNICKLTFLFESDDPEAPSAERMWVIIDKVENGNFTGRLDNEPYYIKDLKVDEIIHFRTEHIIDTDIDEDEPSLPSKYVDRCFVTNRILIDNQQVNYLYREDPETEPDEKYKDSGWRFLAGDEDDVYMDNPENTQYTSIGTVLNIDDSFIHLLDYPVGSSFIRDEDSGLFIPRKN
jgi:hypothetical protein